MQKIKVDYIIVGQGLAGTWLSMELIKRGYSLVVVNRQTDTCSSRKAAGLYNPVTGRKMVKTWRADDLFKNLEANYRELEGFFGEKFLYPVPIYRPFQSVAEQNDWEIRQADNQYEHYLKEVRSSSLRIKHVLDELGGIILKNSGYVDIPKFLDAYKNYLVSKGIYLEEMFDYVEMTLSEKEVGYKYLRACKIIFCEGPNVSNPYWNDLPFRFVRGEMMDIECGLKSDYIINRNIFMIPKGDFFTVGSTYDHKILSYEPQESGIKDLKWRMNKIYNGPYRIISKKAGIRPSTHDHRPYLGFHKKFRSIGIFNGFGTKGVSLSPYFAKYFVDIMEKKCQPDHEVDVQRVY